jgi:hypothetical protein
MARVIFGTQALLAKSWIEEDQQVSGCTTCNLKLET